MVRIQNFQNGLLDLCIISQTEPRYQNLFVCHLNCDFWAQGPPFSKIGSKMVRIQNFRNFLLDLFMISHTEPTTYQKLFICNENCDFWAQGPPFSKIGSKMVRIQNFRNFLFDLFIIRPTQTEPSMLGDYGHLIHRHCVRISKAKSIFNLGFHA